MRKIATILFLIVAVSIGWTACYKNSREERASPFSAFTSQVLRLDELPEGEERKLVQYGYGLITETYKYLGPEIKDKDKIVTGNNLACGNCHLSAGTKPFAAPYVGLTGVFPIYIGRENKFESLEERCNGCFERSMNGKTIPENSKEMQAIAAYIKYLSRNIPVGMRIAGQNYISIHPPDRAADLVRGHQVYITRCLVCHGAKGEGRRKGIAGDASGYLYPPLWGVDSYNDGAGMNRVLTAAAFIKGNMPMGTTADKPVLTDEEAFDVAAFINSHQRPEKKSKQIDYPDLSKKAIDCPYPPYKDSFPQRRHQFGPFKGLN